MIKIFKSLINGIIYLTMGDLYASLVSFITAKYGYEEYTIVNSCMLLAVVILCLFLFCQMVVHHVSFKHLCQSISYSQHIFIPILLNLPVIYLGTVIVNLGTLGAVLGVLMLRVVVPLEFALIANLIRKANPNWHRLPQHHNYPKINPILHP